MPNRYLDEHGLNTLWNDIEKYHNANIAPVIVNTAPSGSIASFDDGADGMPIKKLVANIEPMQDLHGYNSPWPAGGGVNQNNPSAAAEEFDVTGSGTMRYGRSFVGNKTYTIVNNSNTEIYARLPKQDLSDRGTTTTILSGRYTTLTPAADELLWVYGISADIWNNIRVNIAVNLGTDTAWTPYSNICPISGWTGAEIWQTGKNLLNTSELNYGYIQPDGTPITSGGNWLYTGYISVSPTATYTLSGNTATSPSAVHAFYDGSKELISTILASASNSTFTTPSGCVYVRLSIRNSIDAAIQLELGSTATEYEPYSSNQISVTFPSEAGTVYGGNLTINEDGTGTLVSEWANVIFDGSEDENWEWKTDGTANPYARIKIPNMRYQNWGDGFCNRARNGTHTTQDFAVGFGWGRENRVYFFNPTTHLPDVSDLATWRTWLSSNNIQVVYQLNTPVEHTLTASQVTTFLGINNIWANTGDVSVDYPADTKLYIDGINQPTDDDMTADAQIASGKYFIIGNTLYKSTTVIPAGDIIIPGTNCIKTNLAEALNALNA